MKRRKKRRSSAALSERALKDIRKLHRAHLREISAILSNTLGFPVRVSLVPVPVVDEKPRKRASRVPRHLGELAGYGETPLPAGRALPVVPRQGAVFGDEPAWGDLPEDDV